jgi:hypothetical protein
MIAPLLLLLLPQAPVPPAASPIPHFAKARLVASGWPDADAVPMLGDCDGDGFGDLLSLHLAGNGSVEFAHNVHGGKFGTGAIAVRLPDGQSLASLATVRAHRTAGKPERITFHLADGTEWQLGKDALGYLLAPPPPGTADAEGTRVLPLWQKDLALQGDFDGDGVPDTVQGQQLALGADPEHPLDLQLLRDLPPGCKLVAGDFQGDGKDDLLVLRNDTAYRLGRDVSIHLAWLDGDKDQDGDGLDNAREAALKSDPLDADTDRDGLLDGWEVLGEGGIDLPALGASPTHKDCFVFVQRYDNTDGAAAKRDVDRAAAYWASLPAANPDGTTGMHLVPLWLGPLPAASGVKPWWELGEANLPVPARGLAHYMIISSGGGGQSGELADMGGCGDRALYATFLHEFGHQVGLSHSGGQGPGGSPVYTSMMNYSYSYGFNDDYNQIHYSDGALAGLLLDEHKLQERVPVALAKLQFLSKGPYRFHLQADGDGTFVDWNRNGRFDAGAVVANITDTYGVNGGQRFPLGKSLFAPCLVAHKDQLLLFTVDKEHHLLWRQNLGDGKWTEPAALANVAPTGDPWAISHGPLLHVFAPTAAGVVDLAATDASSLAGAAPLLLSDSNGCAVSATVFRDRLLALLWTSPQAPLRCAERAADGSFGAPRELDGLCSEMCAAAAEDLLSGELCIAGGSIEKDKDGEHRRWRLTRMAANADGSFHTVSSVFPGGPKSGWAGNARPVLLCEGNDAPSPGRLHLIGPGWLAPGGNGCFYEAITIGDANQDAGWRLRRFYDEWTTTRWPLGACWHRGDLALAFGWANTPGEDADGNVHVSHHGFGLCDGVLSDFDDITAISAVGLSHSLAWRRGSVQ